MQSRDQSNLIDVEDNNNTAHAAGQFGALVDSSGDFQTLETLGSIRRSAKKRRMAKTQTLRKSSRTFYSNFRVLAKTANLGLAVFT